MFDNVWLNLFLAVVSIGIYFIPTIVAGVREQPNGISIFILNLFLGWTYVGWVVCLVWAYLGAGDKPEQKIK